MKKERQAAKLPEDEKKIDGMEHTSENIEELLGIWEEAIAKKDANKVESLKKTKEVNTKHKEIARLESAINDKKNVVICLT
jgi:hypothetical protein